MSNYHMLPCGTPIPPSGIEAWVSQPNGKEWVKATIIAYTNNKAVTEYINWARYSLTDPTQTKPKKTSAEIAFEKFGRLTKVRRKDWYEWTWFEIDCLAENNTVVSGKASEGYITCWRFVNLEEWHVFEPKKRLVTPMELAGKWLRWNNAVCFVHEIIGELVHFGNKSSFVVELETKCIGYSDTPTSPLKPFWVEEV